MSIKTAMQTVSQTAKKYYHNHILNTKKLIYKNYSQNYQ